MISMDSRTKGRLIFACVLLTPVIAVQGARFIFGPQAAPASAAAAQVPSAPGVPPTLVPPPIRPFTPSQQRAADWLAARVSPESLRSPMDHAPPLAAAIADRPLSAPGPQVQTPVAPTPETADRPKPDLPKLTLTGLLVNGKTRVAALNHRIFRVGDTVVPGWRVARIDSKTRSVMLAGPDGKTAVFQTPPPTLNELPPLTNTTDRGPLKP
ncbi:MAG: hypothetical protein K2Q20_12980 [Phycisphaerales bacterium]|nr:hypothetical protein [Phycisphaerales bacterium]